MDNKKICLITFSNNSDHQNVIYSMFLALQNNQDVYTIGISNPKSSIAPHTERNFYFDCPQRPGIERDTFQLSVLKEIATTIRREKIHYIYFESMHIWNAMLMLLCPQCKKIVAVHDVIPHDGNRAMALCNFVTCHMSNRIVLRNQKYKKALSKKYHIPEDKIFCFQPWRYFPPIKPSSHSGKFLCFGRIRRYKGFDLLEKVVKATPQVQYQIVGEPDEESIPLVRKLMAYKNVEVVDREVSDAEMEIYFTNADWIILPYSAATQSGVIVDACRFSRPVISFNVGAISEQVKNGVSGFLVPQGDTQAFADIVKEAAALSKEEVERFSQEAYQFGCNKYAASAVAKYFLEIIYH